MLKTVNIENEYKKNEGLKKEDVMALKEWADKQPHLPPLTEMKIVIFLQSCFYKMEIAKTTIDTFYTIRTHVPEIFQNRNPLSTSSNYFINLCVFQPLPKPTHQNYRVVYGKMMTPDTSRYSFTDHLKLFDMNMMLWLKEEGTQEGYYILFDMNGFNIGHILKMGIMSMKKFLFYLQDALPVRLKGLHFLNVNSVMDKLLAIMKPFLKKELLDVLYMHTEPSDSLFEIIPKECLPSDYGGTAPSVSELHENMKKKLTDNADFFIEEEKEVVDESKRPGKPKDAGSIFGIEGSFKKLDID